MNFFTPAKMFALALCAVAATANMQSQTTLYFENFDASSTNFPAGWATTTGGWEVSSSNTSTVYVGGSGVNNVKIDNNNAASGTYSLTTSAVSTIGYTNISISWLARLTTNFPPSTISPFLYYSTNNGTTWNSVAYTEMSSASTWTLNSGITLPSNANNQAAVMFQLVATITHTTSGTYRIDDFKVVGTASTTSIDEVTEAGKVKTYAFNKTVYIQLDEANAVNPELSIFSSEGKQVLVKQMSQASEQVDMSAFAPGMYFVNLRFPDSRMISRKVMID